MSDDRVMRNILAGSERRLLIWLAQRASPRVTPDHLTWLGLIGAGLSFFGYLATWLYSFGFIIASFGIVINWYGDSLDGTLARVRQCERPLFGFFFDQTIDLLSTLLIALGLGLSTGARTDLCLLALSGYFAINCSTLVEYTISKRFFVSTSWVGPTELRVLIILFSLSLFFAPSMMTMPLFGGWSLSDCLVGTLAAGLWGDYLLHFIRNYRNLPRV